MTPGIYRRPRTRSIRWGAFAELCARRAVANGRVYIRAVHALERARMQSSEVAS